MEKKLLQIDDDIEIQYGNNKVLLTAPHGVSCGSRYDVYSAMIANELARHLNGTVLIPTTARSLKGYDYNRPGSIDKYYRKRINEIIKDGGWLILDIHSAKSLPFNYLVSIECAENSDTDAIQVVFDELKKEAVSVPARSFAWLDSTTNQFLDDNKQPIDMDFIKYDSLNPHYFFCSEKVCDLINRVNNTSGVNGRNIGISIELPINPVLRPGSDIISGLASSFKNAVNRLQQGMYQRKPNDKSVCKMHTFDNIKRVEKRGYSYFIETFDDKSFEIPKDILTPGNSVHRIILPEGGLRQTEPNINRIIWEYPEDKKGVCMLVAGGTVRGDVGQAFLCGYSKYDLIKNGKEYAYNTMKIFVTFPTELFEKKWDVRKASSDEDFEWIAEVESSDFNYLRNFAESGTDFWVYKDENNERKGFVATKTITSQDNRCISTEVSSTKWSELNDIDRHRLVSEIVYNSSDNKCQFVSFKVPKNDDATSHLLEYELGFKISSSSNNSEYNLWELKL